MIDKDKARLIFHSLNNLLVQIDSLISIFKNAENETINNEQWLYNEQWLAKFKRVEKAIICFSMYEMQLRAIEHLSFLADKNSDLATKQFYQKAAKDYQDLIEEVKKEIKNEQSPIF